jgi:hypothetical protein
MSEPLREGNSEKALKKLEERKGLESNGRTGEATGEDKVEEAIIHE